MAIERIRVFEACIGCYMGISLKTSGEVGASVIREVTGVFNLAII